MVGTKQKLNNSFKILAPDQSIEVLGNDSRTLWKLSGESVATTEKWPEWINPSGSSGWSRRLLRRDPQRLP